MQNIRNMNKLTITQNLSVESAYTNNNLLKVKVSERHKSPTANGEDTQLESTNATFQRSNGGSGASQNSPNTK